MIFCEAFLKQPLAYQGTSLFSGNVNFFSCNSVKVVLWDFFFPGEKGERNEKSKQNATIFISKEEQIKSSSFQ